MIDNKKLFLLSAVLLLGLLRLPGVCAQPSGDFEDLYTSAQKKAQSGRFAESLADFERAYQIHKEPTVVLAMGLMNLQLHRAPTALRLCQQYLRDVPNPPPAKQSQAAACIAQATTLAKEQLTRKATPAPPPSQATIQPSAALPPPPSPPVTIDAPVRISDPQLRSPSATSAEPITLDTPQLSTPPQPDAPPRPLYKKWWFWTAVGAVAAGTALGVGLGLGLKSAPPVADDPLQGIPLANRRSIEF